MRKRDGRDGARVGVRDVAKLAGVSPATVSRMLNQIPGVSPENRDRIQAAMESLHYVPHGMAKSFSQGRSRSIGVIIPALGNSIYAQSVAAIERRLQADHYHLLTAASGYDPQRECELVRALVEQGVDGLILVGNDHVPELYDFVARTGIPTVQTFICAPKSPLPSVGFANYQPVYDLTRHLVNLGHRRFAILHSPIRHNDRIATRYRAIIAALQDVGIVPDSELIVEAGVTVAEGRAGMRALLASGRPFTAVACTGDIPAIGALLEATSAGLKVPDQLSITGFHDHDLASQVEPPLTTIQAPVAEMSTVAAQFLLSRIAGENPPHFRELTTTMVLRRSTAKPPDVPE